MTNLINDGKIGSITFNNVHSFIHPSLQLICFIWSIIVTPSTMVRHASLKMSGSFWNNDRIGKSLKRSAKNRPEDLAV